MWSDNESEVDLLQFRYLASAVCRIVRSPQLLPTTIGVYGDWGSGKSSLLHMVRAELKSDPDVMCLSFSGWLFENYEGAKTALMGSILEAIEERAEDDKSLSQKGRELLSRLLKRVNWMQLATMTGKYVVPAVAGHPHIAALAATGDVLQKMRSLFSNGETGTARPSLEEIQKLLHDAPEGAENVRRSIRDFHRDFEELMRESNLKCLVVLIDDLDRCFHDTIIETLEAIKLFLFVEKTVFVIGADERLVQYAVRQRFPELPGEETEVGRDYLEKLVQFPIRIPPLSGSEIESYGNALFAQLRLDDRAEFQKVCEAMAEFRPGEAGPGGLSELAFDMAKAQQALGTSVPAQLQSDIDLIAQVAPVLTPGLSGNPRRTKRFLNSLLFRLQLSQDRGLTLQRQTLAKLMLLEYLRPEFFKQLAQLQAEQAGKPQEMGNIETALRPARVATEDDSKVDEGAEGSGDVSPQPDADAASQDNPLESKDGAQSAGRGALRDLDRESDKSREDALRSGLPTALQPWLADGWMRAWLGSAPFLWNCDLRPYFYIAHDKIGARQFSPMRLSPAAEAVLNRLLDMGETTQRVGLERAKDLSETDIVAVFDSLAGRLRQSERLDATSPQPVLFKLAQVRREIAPQLVALYSTLPEAKIPFGTPLLVLNATTNSPSADAGLRLLDAWMQSANPTLANAAREVRARATQSAA